MLSFSVSADWIPTIIDGVTVIEFGDYGKAPNQYPLTVGDLNVISSDVVTQLNGHTYVDIFRVESEEGVDLPVEPATE